MVHSSDRKWSLLICLTLIATVLVVFYQLHSFEFVNYDDYSYVYQNSNVQDGITPKSIKWAFTTGRSSNWHPLTWLSHMLDWQLFGANPAGHHITNLIFHIANTLLLFVVLKQMTNALWQSAFVAALFALHPLHVESVAWVAERKDVLSTFFWIVTMAAYLRYVRHPGVGRYLVVLLSFALGLMAKPMLVTLPFVLLLLDYWPLARIPSRQAVGRTDGRRKRHTGSRFQWPVLYSLIREKIPLFALSAVSSTVTFLVQRSAGAVVRIDVIPLKLRVFNALVSYVKYIEKMLWPSRLAVFYPYPVGSIPIWQSVGSLLLLLAVSLLVLRLAAGRRYLLTGWLWYLGTLVPVIGLIQVGSQAMADRYTYVSLIGLFIIVAWGVPEVLAKWRYKKVALVLFALLIILAISICTYLQLSHWRDSETLFQHALDVTENNHIAHYNMGRCMREQGRLDEAVRQFRKFLQLMPEDPDALDALGATLGQQGKLDEAVKYLVKALQVKPDFADAHTDLAHALFLQGDLEGAAVHLAEALRLDPDSALAHFHLGQVLAQMGKSDEAIPHFEEALRLKPDSVEHMNSLAWFLAVSENATTRAPDRAVRLAERACKLTDYKEPELLDTLAAAYAAAGEFSKAVKTAERALELCQSPEKDALKEEIGSRLRLYRAGKPYIETP